MEAVFLRLDELLELDFVFSPTSDTSKINVYLDTTIDLGGGGTTLGVALSNEFRRSSWWEIILNGPPLINDLDYFQFAFVHELGHVLGLEHPFDGSDGDLGGVRFGDPDASVTVMSYTEPVDGWPDFYRPSDLAALVSVWGLESDHAEWLVENAAGEQLLLARQAAEERLALLRPGDALLGPAPAAPEAPNLSRSSQNGSLNLAGLVEQGRWEFSWDGGLHWSQGSGTTLAVASPELKQLTLRQADRWDRLSSELTVLVSREQLMPLTPALLLPAADAASTGLTPLMSGPDGDPVLFWSLDPELAPLGEEIRAAVADFDALVGLDFQELPASDEEAGLAPLVQLSFWASANTNAPLISLDRRIRSELVEGEPLLLDEELRVSLQTEAAASEPAALRLAVFQGLGHAVGLQPVAALLPGTSVMGALDAPIALPAEGELSDLDRAALVQWLGAETGASDGTDPGMDTGPALIRLGQASVRFREGSTGESVTIVELPVQRSGNNAVRVPLLLQAGTAFSGLTLAPGDTEATLVLELPSGAAPELKLELQLPRQALLEPGSTSDPWLDLHALEFGLSTQELIDQTWPLSSSPWADTGVIGWHLAEELEPAWGDRLRELFNTIAATCNLHPLELPAHHPLVQWHIVPRGTETVEAPGIFAVGPHPKASAGAGAGSEEQALLQAMLRQLGLEDPQDPSDGDAYTRTPVYPEDSALFTAVRASSDGEARLQRLDQQALEALYGAAPDQDGDAPTVSLQLNSAATGLRFDSRGLHRQISLNVTREGAVDEGTLLLVREQQLGVAELIRLAPGETLAQVEVPWPEPSTADELEFTLEAVSGASDAVGAQLSLKREQAGQLLPDPITGWTPDLNGDGRFEAQLEGQLLLRQSFGTFPGEALVADLPWPEHSDTSAQHQLELDNRPNLARSWLEGGAASDLALQDPWGIMRILQQTGVEPYSLG
jgi:hypothetical protein